LHSYNITQSHQYYCSKIAWRGTRTAKHCPLPNRLEGMMSRTLANIEYLNFGK